MNLVFWLPAMFIAHGRSFLAMILRITVGVVDKANL